MAEGWPPGMSRKEIVWFRLEEIDIEITQGEERCEFIRAVIPTIKDDAKILELKKEFNSLQEELTDIRFERKQLEQENKSFEEGGKI